MQAGIQERNLADVHSGGAEADYVIGVPVGYSPARISKERVERTRDDIKVRHGVGQLLFAGAAVAYGVVRLGKPFYTGYYYYPPSPETVVIQTVASVLFIGAMCAQLLGFMAAGREWRSVIAYATFGYGLAVLSVVMLATIMMIFGQRAGCSGHVPCLYYSSSWIDTLFVTSSFLLGSLFFMEGGTYLTLGRFTGNERAWAAAGLVAMIGGGFVCVYFAAPIGFFLMAAASTVAGIGWIVYSQEA